MRHQLHTIFCDNKGALELAKNGNFGARTRHIAVAHHFIKEKIEHRIIQVEFVSTTEMIADILTKSTNEPVVRMCMHGMGIRKLKNCKIVK